MRTGAVLLLAIWLTGCAGGPETTPEAATSLVAPLHDLTAVDGVPAGDLRGTLTIDNGCLVIETAAGDIDLALWPPDARFEAIDGAVTVTGAGALARVGDPIHVSGGEYGPQQRSFVEELIGEPVDPACGVDGFWLVSEVLAN